MRKILFALALLSLSNLSYADEWEDTETCPIKMDAPFFVAANYYDDDDLSDLRGRFFRGNDIEDEVIYLKKQGRGSVSLYPLWSADDDVVGIFNEPSLQDGVAYSIRLEYSNVRKHGNSYTGDLNYYLRSSDGSLIRHETVFDNVFSKMSNSADVLIEKDEELNTLRCGELEWPTPTPEPEIQVPDQVCEAFPEPIQGWKNEVSQLIVTNSTVGTLGWSPEYVADRQNIYEYSNSNGQSWDTLRVGFDEGEGAWQLYENSRSTICDDRMGCYPGDAQPDGNDGLIEKRKAQTPAPVNASFDSSQDLIIRTQDTDSNYYGKVCASTSTLCEYSNLNDKVVIRLKSDLNSLNINGYGSEKSVELQIDGTREIKSFAYDAGNNLSLYFSDDAKLTVKTFRNTGSDPKLIFGSDVIFNVVGTNQPVGPVTSADFKLEDAHFDYRTFKDDLVLPVIYGPEASVHFKTDSGQVFKGFILAKSIMLDMSEHIYGAITSLRLDMRGSTKIEKPKYPESCWIPPEPQQCTYLPKETFDNGSVLTNWSVMGFGDSVDPAIHDNRFRLNANRQRQATASAYNYIFPSNQNYLEIEFDHYAYGSNRGGGDGIALVISDANLPPKTGAFGGPLGYGMKLKKNHSSEVSSDVEGFAGGWLGIGIDEYGNFYREGGETIPNRNGRRDSVGIRGSGAQDNQGKWLKGYAYVDGTQFSSSIDNHNDLHRYKITLNSRDGQHMMLKVERSVNGGEWNTVISDFDVRTEGHFSQAPTNFRLSVTASTGAATNFHEVDNFQVCADKYSRLTEGIHHFEFDYSGSGSTCQASDVTLRACMNESCSEQYPRGAYDDGSLTPLSVTLLPSAGNNVANWVGGTNVQFENETQLELQGSRAGDVTLGIDQSSVPQFGFEGARCRINGGALSADNCNVTFAQNVLAVNVNDVVASRETTGEDYLSFCSTRTEENGESRGVNMSVDYEVAPVDSSQPVVISYKQKVKDQAVEWSSDVELTRANKYLPNVYFDSEGKAFFKLKYAEAGKVKLKASVEGVDDSEGFDSFVSFPSKLKVAAKSGNKSGECTNSEDGCSAGFVAAGEAFELTISALQDDDTVAENYQEKTITVSNKVKYPSNGALAKLLNEKLPESSQWSSGSVTFIQSISEVGAFEIIAEAPVAKDENGDDIGTSLYLGSKAFKIADGQSTIGRFYPDYFKVTGTEWTYPDNQHDSVYMGQGFASVKFEVTAYNASGYATQNYGGFADSLKADLHLAGGYSDRLSISGSDLTSENWSGAIWSKTWVNSVNWSKAVNPDGPFNSKVSTDSSTESSIALSLNKTASTKTAHIDPTLFLTEGDDESKSRTVDQRLLSQPDVRYGRMVLDDVGGRQGETLSVPLRVEYWNNNRFTVSEHDNRAIVSPFEAGSDELIWSSPDGTTACDIVLKVFDASDNEISNAQVEQGILPNTARERLIAKQGCNNDVRQQSKVWLDLTPSGNNLPWLKYDWDNDGSEENPSSVVTFGIHRGNDRVIYRGEPGLTAP
ncbi:MSHA biogenesis protein MshQ [Vibrio sp. ES.051]|uniref:DUF6701 domain-containing protein n=1 Tax=Vibrio sp. ES.051 TaxID=1761909 RepID=UPI000BF2C8D6|nr:DUF6701 domain-containing protein [Vibrio sp. ES.051]PFG55208.1 MSHA biogenesis protein MshQ [Vibrio sp. ES.051]